MRGYMGMNDHRSLNFCRGIIFNLMIRQVNLKDFIHKSGRILLKRQKTACANGFFLNINKEAGEN